MVSAATVAPGIPQRLRHEPLLEAVWELRFAGDQMPMAELLPGVIYQKLSPHYPRIESLPTAGIPLSLRQQDATLRYLPTVRLQGDRYSIQIGEHMVSLSCPRPYAGWPAFGAEVRALAALLRETALITRPERFSLKYVDLVPSSTLDAITALNVDIRLGERAVGPEPLRLRIDLHEDDFVHIVQLASPAGVTLPSGENFQGVLLDIDTISQGPQDDFWTGIDSRLERGHALGKALFFRLLRPQTLADLGPEY